jgi:hypothetical protein
MSSLTDRVSGSQEPGPSGDLHTQGGLDNPLWVINTYNRLLIDVSQDVGLARPAALSIEDIPWVLTEGPRLDKVLLDIAEHKGESPSQEYVVPDWLLPLWNEALVEIREPTTYPYVFRAVHQLLQFGYKAEVVPNETQIMEAQASFERTDRNCSDAAERILCAFAGPKRGEEFTFLRRVLTSARHSVGQVTSNLDLRDIIPSHGPGAVFPPIPGYCRSDFRQIHVHLEPYYPYTDFFVSGLSGLDARMSASELEVCETSHSEAKLTAVPKDSRGPRLICVHPRELIWIQQGQRRALERAITQHRLTRGRINFDDQTVNGQLALASSYDREYCTLDLKDASDRVSCTLVDYLFSSREGNLQWDLLSASRATQARLIDGRVIQFHLWFSFIQKMAYS